jgi:hypothetical protein
MFLSFRAAVIGIAFAATMSAAQGQKAGDPKDDSQMEALMQMMLNSISTTGEKHLDENTRNVIKQLTIFPLEKLYMLKMSDTCEVAGFSCGSFKAEKIIPLIDIEIDRRKAIMDAADKQRSFYLSLGSLLISFCALGLSVFGLFKKERRAMET